MGFVALELLLRFTRESDNGQRLVHRFLLTAR
jgi:hypothetical protein